MAIFWRLDSCLWNFGNLLQLFLILCPKGMEVNYRACGLLKSTCMPGKHWSKTVTLLVEINVELALIELLELADIHVIEILRRQNRYEAIWSLSSQFNYFMKPYGMHGEQFTWAPGKVVMTSGAGFNFRSTGITDARRWVVPK